MPVLINFGIAPGNVALHRTGEPLQGLVDGPPFALVAEPRDPRVVATSAGDPVVPQDPAAMRIDQINHRARVKPWSIGARRVLRCLPDPEPTTQGGRTRLPTVGCL